jgi:demethylmenaquinone methyltransferase / 2-methoxy-6-polyprenyl-1,4-benzoquinol methylase
VSEVSDPIFARIARRYDRINGILSLGQEKRWRGIGVEMLEPGLVLDLGCGTGDTDFDGREVIGLDPVPEMIKLSPVPARVVGIGENLPIRDGALDGVFSAFVFRNLTSIDRTLEEIQRALRPGASAVIVDLARPVNPFLRLLHRIGTAVILPLVGLLFARAPREYWYLHKSLDSLPPPDLLYEGRGLIMEEVWRSGVFGFVYGVRLRKPRAAMEKEPEAA